MSCRCLLPAGLLRVCQSGEQSREGGKDAGATKSGEECSVRRERAGGEEPSAALRRHRVRGGLKLRLREHAAVGFWPFTDPSSGLWPF
jgi:hypothetical protein